MSLNPLFRLQGIPVSLNKAEIRTHLINDPDIRLCLEKACGRRPLQKSHPEPIPDQSAQLHIITLAHSPGDTSRNTAIWKFTCDVEAPVVPKLHGKKIQCSCVICRKENTYGSFMVIDHSFCGLTSLHSPAEYDVDWEVDIVAISGYMGHPLGSFKQKDGEFMWLKDELPDDIPTARIFTYGYYFANACRTLAPEGLFDQEEGLSRIIAHLGSDFVEALHSIRSGMFLATGKPLVLIGHSIGGIIIKEAIMQMLKRAESETLAIVNSIAGLLFFDTPHTGMTDSFQSAMSLSGPGIPSLELLTENPVLFRHAKHFEQMFQVDDCEIICFYAARIMRVGLIEGSYEKAFYVEEDSAIACKPLKHVSFQTVRIEKNHWEMVQFDPHDFNYVTKVLPRLEKYRQRGEARPEHSPETVFRLRGIPRDCSTNELPSLVKTCLSIRTATNIQLGSMAKDPIDSTELTATISFSKVPVKLSKKLSRHGSGDEWHFHQLKVGRFGNVYLVLDKHFRGLTPLHSCEDDRCGTDLIALSGLNGHAFGSFKVKGDSFMWLRDSLPAKLPRVRILIYGYDTQLVGSRSFQTLQDLGLSLRATLHAIETPKPTILLGHSLGGLVTKDAMAFMDYYATPSDIGFLRSIKGILFFGTPHLGMDISSLVPLVRNNPNIVLLKTLQVGSTELADLGMEFERALMHGRASIKSFHETVESPTAIRTQAKTDDDNREVWSMRGPPAKLVSVRSAMYGGGHPHPINRDHSNLVKFDGPYDQVYRHTLDVLRRMVRRDL